MINKSSLRQMALAGAILVGLSSSGVAQSSQTGKRSRPDDDNVAQYSIGVFGGIQAWKLQRSSPNPDTLAPGGAFGIRADQDFRRYLGVEEAWTAYAVNNLRLKVVPGQGVNRDTVAFGARNGQVFVGPLFYLTPPSSPIRPFFTVGPAFQYFWATHEAKQMGRDPNNAVLNAPRLGNSTGPALVFGGGIKGGGQRIGVRIDVHGIWAQNPHLNLTGISSGPGSVYIKQGGTQLGLQATLGLDWRWGHHEPPPIVPPQTKTCPDGSTVPIDQPCPPPAKKDISVTVTASPASVCPGASVTVSTNTDIPASSNPTYQWTVNGDPVGTASTLNFGTNGREPGDYKVAVTVNADGYNSGTGSTTITVQRYGAPTGTVTASPSEIPAGQTSTLSANFSGTCSGDIQPATFTASEGSVRGNTFDSTGVQFDSASDSEQRKPVTITATAVGQGGSGTATTTVTVVKAANLKAKRLPDIVFARNNARVNNCGKRVLLEELKTYLDKDPTGKVVFVGHDDKGESKGLDRRRALNAAAIVSAGQGICLNFAPTQVMVSTLGAEQGSVDFQPYFCGTSTAAKTQERSGQGVNANDKRAQYRRVEVWFVPTNGQMPESGGSAADATSMGVSKLGCPK
jgi:outer membrane protein OmpA-like peptidoglycan-associated protein